MGQYYMPVLIDDQDNISTLYSHGYENGLKLMEHSWVGNKFVNAVLTQIRKRPLRVAWIGDYSDSYDGDLYESKLPEDVFKRYYDAAWGEDEEQHSIHPESEDILTLKSAGIYLVNHTAKVYLDLEAYIATSKWAVKGCYVNGKYDENASRDWCVNPLPLLTACGNGRGGGDYHDNHPNYNRVGEWAFDLIELTDEKPDGYEPFSICFTENNESEN